MKQKVLRPLLLQMMGLLITQCVMLTYNPLAAGWFGAMTTIEKNSIVTITVMIAGLYYAMGTLGAAKYGMIMVTIMFCTTLYRRKNGKVTIRFASFITGMSIFIMEISDWFMGVEFTKLYGSHFIMENYYQLLMIIMLTVASTSGCVVFSNAVASITGNITGLKSGDNYITRQINQAIVNNNQGMMKLATGFKDLSYRIMDLPVINGSDRSEFNTEMMVKQITGCVCSGCINSGVCWGSKAEMSKENVLEMMKIAKNDGMITKERLPTALSNQCMNQKELVTGVNHIFERARLNFLWRMRMEEGRHAVALQLGEMADMVENFAKPDYSPAKLNVEMEEYIKQKLREKKIVTKKLSIIENKSGIIQIDMYAKSKSKKGVKISEAENVLSECMGQRMCVTERGWDRDLIQNRLIKKEYKHLYFTEDTNFSVLYGIARQTKADENISGDNYAVTQIGMGQTFLSVCDGMGSGKRANRYSEIVVDLLEKLLRNGFAEDTALRLINSVFMLGNQWDSPLAVDIGLVDLYSGTCNFMKMGAASTYIKRGNWVECLKSASLPMGASDVIDSETITKKLYSGDFIIMISDGIVEALNARDKEEAMGRIIMDIDTVNPRELAGRILSDARMQSENMPRDDMTVLVLGIWDKI